MGDWQPAEDFFRHIFRHFAQFAVVLGDGRYYEADTNPARARMVELVDTQDLKS